MGKILVLLALIASPACAAIGFDNLRGLVLANDFAAVDAALLQAHEEFTAAHQPDAERALYNVFSLSDPAIGRFALDWVAQQPENPRALTAKGWNLYAWGWIMRGDRVVMHTSPEAIEEMLNRHHAAFDLFEHAAQLAPDLIPASDGLLRLTTTLGNISTIPMVLERVMTANPNRGSLMRAMPALAPQWGGRLDQVDLLCNRYAGKITDIKEYTPDVCAIDAVYWANFWQGEQRGIAHQKLMFMLHPILDYARYQDMMQGLLSSEDTDAALKKIQAEGGLSYKEAKKLDWMDVNRKATETGQVPSQNEIELPNYAKALLRDLGLSKINYQHDPMNPDALLVYIDILQEAAAYADRPISPQEQAEVTQYLKAILMVVPTDPRLWSHLAKIVAKDHGLEGLAAAAPYYHNAIYYSQFDNSFLSEAIAPKIQYVLSPNNNMELIDLSKFSTEDVALLDESVHCPMVSQLLIAENVCRNEGIAENQCGAGMANNAKMMQRLRDRTQGGHCPEFLKHDAFWGYDAPAQVDLSK
jgi:hypothetical protein